MNVIFRFKDVAEIVSDGEHALEANTYDVQKVAYKKQRKKDGNALFLNPNVLYKIIEEEKSKEAWGKLKNLYAGDENLMRVKLQTLRKQFEITQMNRSRIFFQD
ncbi:unnamed protein product [Lathyrus oleraceus]